MKLLTLLNIPSEDRYKTATLFFNTVRIGFPTADIVVYLHAYSKHISTDIETQCKIIGARVSHIKPFRHHNWLEYVISNCNEKIAIIDGDTIWWENCENLTTPQNLSGRWLPTHQSEFCNLPTIGRLHTSFLHIQDCDTLRQAISDVTSILDTDFCRPILYEPVVTYGDRGMFHDTFAGVSNIIPNSSFTPDILNRYDHLFAGSAKIETLYRHLKDPSPLLKIHELAKFSPEKLRGLWQAQERYYALRAL